MMFFVTEQELDDFDAGFSSLNSVLFGVFASGSISFITVLLTGSITDLRISAAIWVVVVVGAALTLFFGVNMRRDSDRCKEKLQAIKEKAKRRR